MRQSDYLEIDLALIMYVELPECYELAATGVSHGGNVSACPSSNLFRPVSDVSFSPSSSSCSFSIPTLSPSSSSSASTEESCGAPVWEAVIDLDKFLCGIYRYWAEGGFVALVASHVSHLIALGFTVYFSWFLLFFVNWGGVVRCTSEEACKQATVFTFDNPLTKTTPFYLLCNIYFGILNCFLVWNLFLSASNCVDAWATRCYFRSRLKIPSDEALSMLDWPELVALLLKAQEENPFCIVEMNLTVLDIVSIIMREENYLVAMTNRDLLTSAVPRWFPCRYVYSKPLFWSIRTALFMDMFDRRSRVHLEKYRRPIGSNYRSLGSSPAACALATRFRYMAVLNLLFMVPTFVFIIIYFFLKHAEDFRTNRGMPFKREFNGYAYWTFREINELPHQLERRLAAASSYAEEHVNSGWQNPVTLRAKLCCKYITGAFLAVLLALYFVDEAPLLYVKLADRNLLWYTIVLGFLYALMTEGGIICWGPYRSTRPLVPENTMSSGSTPVCSSTHLSPISMYLRCMRVVQYTHYLPASWRCPSTHKHFRDSLQTPELSALHKHVLNDFCTKFYVIRVLHLFEELFSVILAPIVLFFWMPHAADAMCDFVASCTYRSSVGDLCAFSLLDIRANGSAFYNAPVQSNDDLDVYEFSRGHTENKIYREHIRGEDTSYSLTPDHDPEMYIMGALRASKFNGNCCSIKSYSGKLEKSLLTYVLYYRLPAPYDDSSPMWAVFATEEMLISIMSPLHTPLMVPNCVDKTGKYKEHKESQVIKAFPGNEKSQRVNDSGNIRDFNDEKEMSKNTNNPEDFASRSNSKNNTIIATSRELPIEPIDGVANGDSEPFGYLWKKWGYSEEAIMFVERLENFQAEHMRLHPYLKNELPSDLATNLQTFSISTGTCNSESDLINRIQNFVGPPPLNEGVQAAYFFWLEKFYEVKSGRIFYPTNQLNHYLYKYNQK